MKYRFAEQSINSRIQHPPLGFSLNLTLFQISSISKMNQSFQFQLFNSIHSIVFMEPAKKNTTFAL
jgi:hypothetical protein